MANFDIAYRITEINEGGYANNPADTGGETYKGIARKHHPKWDGWAILDAIKPHTVANINKVAGANTTLQNNVKDFYRVNYWQTNNLSLIADQQLANNAYDFGVNAGVYRAAKYLQTAYNSLVACDKLLVDGNIGSKSINAINLLNGERMYNAFNSLRKGFYDAIIANNPSQKVFRNSWYSRIVPYKK